jgi:hypothetical protein
LPPKYVSKESEKPMTSNAAAELREVERFLAWNAEHINEHIKLVNRVLDDHVMRTVIGYTADVALDASMANSEPHETTIQMVAASGIATAEMLARWRQEEKP